MNKFPLELYGLPVWKQIPLIEEKFLQATEEYIHSWNGYLRHSKFEPVRIFRKLFIIFEVARTIRIKLTIDEFNNIVSNAFPIKLWPLFENYSDNLVIISFEQVDEILRYLYLDYSHFVPSYEDTGFLPSELQTLLHTLRGLTDAALSVMYGQIYLYSYAPETICKYAPKHLGIEEEHPCCPLNKLVNAIEWFSDVFPRYSQPELKIFRLYTYLNKLLKLHLFTDNGRTYGNSDDYYMYLQNLTSNPTIDAYLTIESDPYDYGDDVYIIYEPESLYDVLWEQHHSIEIKGLMLSSLNELPRDILLSINQYIL